jgi:hypothetical protein
MEFLKLGLNKSQTAGENGGATGVIAAGPLAKGAE